MKSKEAGNDYRVIKNTLLKKALNADNITEIDYTLVEPTALVVVKEDFAAAAKLAKKYAKDAAMSKFFAIKGGYFDGMALDQSGIEKLADLPSRRTFGESSRQHERADYEFRVRACEYSTRSRKCA